jgi:hypothetical protein
MISRSRFFWVMGGCFLMAWLGWVPMQASAQAVKGDAEAKSVRIRKVSGLGARGLVETPRFQSSAPVAGTKPAQKWGQILVSFDTEPEWLDEVTVQYFVLSRRSEGGKPGYSLHTVTVVYTDVKRGRDHLGAAYLRPAAIERFGAPTAVAVEISVGGKVVAEESVDEGIRLSARWWKDPAVVESKDLTQRNGYLLDKARSPFALIAVDDYEVSRP